MQSIFWALGSLLILVPIIYFLPLGLSLRGKWIIIAISFLLAIMGLSARTVFPLWETAIILLVLIGILVYLLDKKLGRVLYPSTSAINTGEDPDQFLYDIDALQTVEKQTNDLPLVEEIIMLQVSEPVSSGNKNSHINELDDALVIPVKVNFHKENDDSDGSNGESITERFEDLYESIAFLEDRNHLLEENKQSIEEHPLPLIEESYSSEIEELMNQEIANSEVEGISNLYQSNLTQGILTELVSNPLEEESVEEVQSINHFDLEVELKDELEFIKSFAETAATAWDDGMELINQETEEMEKLDVKEQSLSTIEIIDNEEQSNPIIENLNLEEQKVEIKEQNGQRSDTGPIRIQKELLRTIISQLKIAGKTLHPLEYEKLIKEHMNSRLSVHDYYTFASILIEHYIRTKEYNKLELLINETSSKVAEYPILEKVMEYVFERYCKKSL